MALEEAGTERKDVVQRDTFSKGCLQNYHMLCYESAQLDAPTTSTLHTNSV